VSPAGRRQRARPARGAIARVSPATRRSPIIDEAADGDVVWAMVGAPLTGGPDEWDPGATVFEWPLER
jgi:hypothetical protein